MSRLKLVGAQTYYCTAIQGGSILYGQVKEVEDPKVVASLLAETTYDKKDNVIPVFELVDDGQEPEGVDDEPEADEPDGDPTDSPAVTEPKRRAGRTTAKA